MPKAPWLPTTTACWRGSALWPTPPTALDPRGSRGVALASVHVDALPSVGLGVVHGRVRAPHPVARIGQQGGRLGQSDARTEEHTFELQSLMNKSHADSGLKNE